MPANAPLAPPKAIGETTPAAVYVCGDDGGVLADKIEMACAMFRAGFGVTFSKPNSKVPQFAGWRRAADEAEIRRYLTENPASNALLLTDGFVVVDSDRGHGDGQDGPGALRDWERANGALPATWTVITGAGGLHRYYRQRSGDAFRNRVGGRAGMVDGNDIRANGGLVMAPGSVHPATGRVYAFASGCSPGEMPMADVDGVVAKLATWGIVTGAAKAAPERSDSIPVGGRHDAFLSMACSMRAKGYGMKAAMAALAAENEEKCAEPLPAGELESLVRDVWGRYDAAPRPSPACGGQGEGGGYSLENRWRAEQADLRNLPPDPDDLISERLSLGGKMIMSAPSKADKSWLAINLAETIAVGGTLLGMRCARGRVLYVNLEVRRSKFYRRLLAVAEARGYNLDEVAANLDVINMRGFYQGPEAFDGIVSSEVRRMLGERPGGYVCIVVDPLYKLNFDENKAQEVGKVCEAIDHFAEEFGCAVVQVHHHSKGPKADRAAIDRASGSGVLGRDPDCILDILEVFPPSGENPYGDEVRGFVFDWSLRDFKTPAPQRVLYKWPIHMLDSEGAIADWEAAGSGSSREAAKTRAKVAQAEAEAEFAKAQLAIAAAFVERGIGPDEGMPAKDAAEIAGMRSRTLTEGIDRHGSDLFRYGRKPGRRPGTYTKENYIFLKPRPPEARLDSMEGA